MPFSLRKLTKLHFIAFCLLASLGLSTFAFSWRDWISKPTNKSAAVVAAVPAIVQTAANSSPIKVISITVNSDGFSPSDVEVPEGLYMLDINDRSGLPAINVQLGNLNAKKLKEVKPAKDKQGRILKIQDYRALFNLENGQYTITEADHPKWSLKLKVTAKPK